VGEVAGAIPLPRPDQLLPTFTRSQVPKTVKRRIMKNKDKRGSDNSGFHTVFSSPIH